MTLTYGGRGWVPSYADLDRPRLEGDGPVEFSTCVDLAVPPGWVHDVNGYYRELGVSWRASRADLRRAYQRLEGYRSPRLTYVLSQLLNEATRRAYDRQPLGQPFPDRYVLRAIVREAQRRQAERATRAGLPVDDPVAALAQVLAGMGYDVDPDRVDSAPEASDDVAPAREQHPQHFPYAYYLWRADGADHARLARWQLDLVRALSSRGVVARIAVGHVGEGRPWHVQWVGGRFVAFMGVPATAWEADQAADAIESLLDR